jgi:hypothetical protein
MLDDDFARRTILAQQATRGQRRRLPVQVLEGTVTAVAAGPPPSVSCRVDGVVTPGLRYLTGWTPMVGQKVIVQQVGTDRFVVGPLAAAAGAGYASKAGDTFTGPVVMQGTLAAASLRHVEALVNVNESTTSTAYADLATVGPDVTFTAPPSGIVLVVLSATIGNGTTGTGGWMGFERRQGTTVVSTPFDSNALLISGYTARASAAYAWGGLTPGVSYTARAKYKSAGGAPSFLARRLTVIPSP